MAVEKDRIFDIRVGNGYDFHVFKVGRPLILGGERIKLNLAQVLQLAPSRVGLKATTMEGKGPIGRGEGLAAQVIVSLIPSGNKS